MTAFPSPPSSFFHQSERVLYLKYCPAFSDSGCVAELKILDAWATLFFEASAFARTLTSRFDGYSGLVVKPKLDTVKKCCVHVHW